MCEYLTFMYICVRSAFRTVAHTLKVAGSQKQSENDDERGARSSVDNADGDGDGC